jgi:hypothetical protein
LKALSCKIKKTIRDKEKKEEKKIRDKLEKAVTELILQFRTFRTVFVRNCPQILAH